METQFKSILTRGKSHFENKENVKLVKNNLERSKI